MPDNTHELVAVMSSLYESEINCRISSFWDGGFTVEIGDEMNGFHASKLFYVAELYLAGRWLGETARTLYPQSVYAGGKGGSIV